MYEIVFSEKAKKQFLKLEKDIQNRIISVLERIRIRPESYVERLVGEQVYKLRVGDYRVIMDLENNRLIVLILKVGHRKNVYDNM